MTSSSADGNTAVVNLSEGNLLHMQVQSNSQHREDGLGMRQAYLYTSGYSSFKISKIRVPTPEPVPMYAHMYISVCIYVCI